MCGHPSLSFSDTAARNQEHCLSTAHMVTRPFLSAHRHRCCCVDGDPKATFVGRKNRQPSGPCLFGARGRIRESVDTSQNLEKYSTKSQPARPTVAEFVSARKEASRSTTCRTDSGVYAQRRHQSSWIPSWLVQWKRSQKPLSPSTAPHGVPAETVSPQSCRGVGHRILVQSTCSTRRDATPHPTSPGLRRGAHLPTVGGQRCFQERIGS